MEKKSNFYKIMAIIALVFAIIFAIVTTIIVNNKQRELDDLNDKNDQIESLLPDEQNFQNSYKKTVDIAKNI